MKHYMNFLVGFIGILLLGFGITLLVVKEPTFVIANETSMQKFEAEVFDHKKVIGGSLIAIGVLAMAVSAHGFSKK